MNENTEEPKSEKRSDIETVSGKLLEALTCPASGGKLDYDREKQELISKRAQLAFPIRSGIPIMLLSEARKLDI